MFRKVLIANRGEIAVRIVRACHDLGICAVAVYSDADRGALHVRRADEAHHIGPSAASQSYLNIARILETAVRAGVDAVHPGYGFLSENAEFARAVVAAGMTFIGPSASAIALMGSKLASRTLVRDADVRVVPGSLDAITSDQDATDTAAQIGFPVMLKASAGGGGKGMRRVDAIAELASALRETRAEALAAFGDDAIYIEKVIARPRHIEVQIVADRSGNAVHLGERECTIQRRHQKLIEEAPSPVVGETLREQLGDAALRVSRAAGYDNVGTVEFLLDSISSEFFFLEMNTRIQVEHPITEAVTGIDLVAAQMRIAAGEQLSIAQSDVKMRGAAIECRIYAEDPDNDFLPCPGRIQRLDVPSGPGIRDDAGIYPGWDVPIEYDPILSKLIAWAPARQQAINRMQRALAEYRIDGIRNNLKFFRDVLGHPEFLTGQFDTGFVDRLDKRPGSPRSPLDRDLAVLAAAIFSARETRGGWVRESQLSADNWKRTGRRNQMRKQ